MHADRVVQQPVQRRQRRFRARVDRAGRGQRRATMAGGDAPSFDDESLPRQDPRNAPENRLPSGGELKIQQFAARGFAHHGPHDARREQCPGLGGEVEPARRFGVIERLDAERIARQDQAAGRGIVDGDRVHAAQPVGEFGTILQVKMQRRLAVGLGAKRRAGQFVEQFDVIVNLAVGDERGTVRPFDRLPAGRQIDDREASLQQGDAAPDTAALAVRPAMGQRPLHGIENARRRRRAVGGHDASDPAHGTNPISAGRKRGTVRRPGSR